MNYMQTYKNTEKKQKKNDVSEVDITPYWV